MITEFKLPGLGENVKSGIATKILVKPGDSVKPNQTIVELETDKAVLEVPCSIQGVVTEVLIKQGGEVKVGQAVLKIDTQAQSGSAISTTSSPASTPSASLSTATVGSTSTITAATKFSESTSSITRASAPAAKTKEASLTTAPQDKNVPAAPSVRRFAREIGIDITQVPGTGPGGRISLEDVKTYSKALNAQPRGSATMGSIVQQPLPDFSKWGQIERLPMSMIRKKTAEHLSYAWSTIPHVTQFDKVDITELDALRKRFAKKVEASGGKLTITSFVLKVIASALKVFPQFNASVDMTKNELIYKKYFNVGVAVDTDRGLLVPVIRDVDKKSLTQISVELAQIAERARTKKTTIEEMQGGCFTITNLGGIGGTYFTPIVNSPEVAILGLSRSQIEGVYQDDKLTPRLMLPLSLSYDHRIIDGADGARFLRWVCDAIQQPFLMDLGG